MQEDKNFNVTKQDTEEYYTCFIFHYIAFNTAKYPKALQWSVTKPKLADPHLLQVRQMTKALAKEVGSKGCGEGEETGNSDT